MNAIPDRRSVTSLSPVKRDIKLYIGIAETKWNGWPIPAQIEYACVSPISGRTTRSRQENWVTIPAGVQVIQDSGAFSDSWDTRLSLSAAWDRQVAHAEKHGYGDQVTHRASYDLLIDETWQDGKRSKKRWTYEDAADAVQATIAASQFAAAKRDNIGLIQSAQGVEPDQYLNCVQQIVPYIDPARDKLGLGGWCILGMRRELMPVFYETVQRVIPFVAQQGIKSVHIWGVIYPPALGLLLWWADQHGIEVSTDSTSPALQVVWGCWGYAEWQRPFDRIPSNMVGAARMIHACQTKHYLAALRGTEHYVSQFTGAKLVHECEVCGKPITKKATTCSVRCRKRKSRGVTLHRSANEPLFASIEGVSA